jgi:hypothetical protein
VFAHLFAFLLSILSSLVAWLLTVKVGDSFKQKPRSRIVLTFAVFVLVFIVLTTLQTVTEQVPQEQSAVKPMPTPLAATKKVPEPRREHASKSDEPKKKAVNDIAADAHGEFTTESYKFIVNSIQRHGATATVSVTLESLSNKEIYFTIMRDPCYLVDENGDRWTLDGHDPARFIEAGSPIEPETKIKSKFSFTALDSNMGSQFTLVCTEVNPKYGRKIVVRRLSFL